MRVKDGVDLGRLRPELRCLEPLVDMAYADFEREAVVTSTYDGTHRADSLHYRDAAFDLRVNHIGGAKMQTIFHVALARQIYLAYPGLYDVLLEHPGEEGAHIHIEPSPILVAQMFPEDDDPFSGRSEFGAATG